MLNPAWPWWAIPVPAGEDTGGLRPPAAALE